MDNNKQSLIIKKKKIKYNKIFVVSSTDDSDYLTDSDCGCGCGCFSKPQFEDAEIKKYIDSL